MRKHILSISLIFSFLFTFHNANAQLTADAGGNRHFCTYPDSTNTLIIGGEPTAINGNPPYTYIWSMAPKELYPGSDITIYASGVLNDTTLANPHITDFTTFDSLTFFLKVSDNQGNESFDTCLVTISSFTKTLMYYTYQINQGDSIFLVKGVNVVGNYNITAYHWTPSESLDDPTLSNNLWAKPDSSTWYSVKITDEFGCVAQGDPFYHVIVLPLGTNENVKSTFDIFPNPSSHFIQISKENNVKINKIQLISLDGKIVKEFNASTNLYVGDVEKGVYILSILHDTDEIYRRKVIVK